MFDEFGWKVPETVSELKTLCETIVSDTKGSVAPFVYPGKVSGGYWGFHRHQLVAPSYGRKENDRIHEI